MAIKKSTGSSDMRYRPYYYDWACVTTWEIDSEMLQVDDLLTLIDRAGFGIGAHEWRPEKGGDMGRFKIDTKFKVRVENLT